MAEIYGKSRNTAIWLGEFDSALDATLFAHLCRYIRDNKDVKAASSSMRELLAKMLFQLLSRPWFNRRWVIQEYALSLRKVFIVGDQWHSHTDLIDVMAPLVGDKNSTILSEFAKDAKPMDAYDRSLLQRLHVFQSAAHSQPHDCVYALLGIRLDRSVFPVEYGIPLQDLFVSIAREYARQPSTLPLLFASALSRPRNPTHPSWLPDWNIGRWPSAEDPRQYGILGVLLEYGLDPLHGPSQSSSSELVSSNFERPRGKGPEMGPSAVVVEGRFLKMWTYLLDAELLQGSATGFILQLRADQRAIPLKGDVWAVLRVISTVRDDAIAEESCGRPLQILERLVRDGGGNVFISSDETSSDVSWDNLSAQGVFIP